MRLHTQPQPQAVSRCPIRCSRPALPLKIIEPILLGCSIIISGETPSLSATLSKNCAIVPLQAKEGIA